MAADVTVSGKTHARSRTSHLETTSTLPGGGLHVRMTKPHRHKRLRCLAGTSVFAIGRVSLQSNRSERPIKERRAEEQCVDGVERAAQGAEDPSRFLSSGAAFGGRERKVAHRCKHADGRTQREARARIERRIEGEPGDRAD